MPTDAESLKWVEVADFSPGIYGPRGTILNASGPVQLQGQVSAPLGSAQLYHAIEEVVQQQAQVLDFTDSSGNGYDLTQSSSTATSEPGLLPNDNSDGAIGITTVGVMAERVLVPPASLPVTSSWWMCGWVNTLEGQGTICQIDGQVVGGSPIIFFGWNIDVPGVSTQLEMGRRWSGGVEFKFSTSVPLTGGPYFIFGSYNSGTDTYKFYVNGVLVTTVAGGGHTFFGTPDEIFIGEGNGLGLTIFDEIAFGAGVVVDATVAAIYNDASISYGAWVSGVMSMSPLAFYHLSSSPAVPFSRTRFPGTYRCVSAPGKGLIGAPRKLPLARVIQEYPIISANGLSNIDIVSDSNIMVDDTGNNHHGQFNLGDLLRVPGSFGDDAGISVSIDATSPMIPFQTPVDHLNFNSDWTVNIWAKLGDNALSKNLFEVNSDATGSKITAFFENSTGLGGFSLNMSRNPNGAGASIQILSTTLLPHAYHMISITYAVATSTYKLYIDGVLVDTDVGVPAVPAIFGTDALFQDGLVCSLDDSFDNLSFHPRVWSAAQLLTLFGANADYPTYRTALFVHGAPLDPLSFYPFNEDGSHAVGELRALVTASHLVSPVLEAGAAIQATPPDPPAYQDGLFASFSWFTNPIANSVTNMWNKVDARFYKLWQNPITVYDLREGFTPTPEPFLVEHRLDGSLWSAPFWHGIGDFAEIVNSVTSNGQKPFTRQVVWLYNMIQSQNLPEPWAMLLVGYPNETTHTVDSSVVIGAANLGTIMLTPELVFSHEGRLCVIDGYDGDAFGTDVAGRGMNDIVYYSIRAALFSAFQIFSLQRPIEENQSGIRVAQSVNANELFLVKATGGGAVISGDLDFPTVRRLPGLHSPGDIYAKPTNTPIGVVYAGHGGVFLWSGAESSQLLSSQFDGPFWSPYLGVWSSYTPPANRFGFHGGFDYLHPWVLCPSHFLFDTRFQSWWMLDSPDQSNDGSDSAPYPSFFMHGTSQGHILAVMPEINEDQPVLAERYDPSLMADNYAWTSQPITPEHFRVCLVREINVQATNPETDNSTADLTITIAGLNGQNESHTYPIPADGLSHSYRLTFAMETETFVVSLESGADTGKAAPIIHSFRVGYETTAEHPETATV